MLKFNSRRHVNELDALTTVQVMARKAYNQQEGTKVLATHGKNEGIACMEH